MPTGGSIESVTLDGRTFSVASDADSQRKLGGFENEVQPNGDGTTREVKTRVAWSLADLTLSIDDLAGDHTFLQGLANRIGEYPITIAYASGAIYQGSGQVVGEVQVSSMNATAALGLMGSGTLTPQ